MGRILKAKVLGQELEFDPKKTLEVVKAAAGDEEKSESESRKLVERAADELLYRRR